MIDYCNYYSINQTRFFFYAKPKNIFFYQNISCYINDELQLSNTWIPVTHLIDNHAKTTNGVFMYYARGCSEMEFNTGRTLSALNKIHAAIKVTIS